MNKLKKDKKDALHTIAKAGLSSIPLIGGAASEIFSSIITPPLTKRRDDWIKEIAEGLKLLQKKVSKFNIENLSNNDAFITTLMHATQIAIRNHKAEKVSALRNCVLNAALPNPLNEDIQIMFLNFIDIFTSWHLILLKFFKSPREWGRINKIEYPNWSMGGAATVIEYTFPELKNNQEFYDQITKDLYNNGLLKGYNIHATVTAGGMFNPLCTNLGIQFLDFIEKPK
jgi:hypothetical protein